MNKEEQLLEKRLIELSNLAFSRDIVTFSDFLNLNELNILHIGCASFILGAHLIFMYTCITKVSGTTCISYNAAENNWISL